MPAPKTRIRLFRFLIVGGTGMAVQLATVGILKDRLPARVAYTIAYVLSVATHYSLNRFWALASARRDTGRQFLEYLGTIGLSYLVSFSCFNLFLAVVKLGVMWSTALAIPPSTAVVFLLLNYRVFRPASSA